MRCAGRTAPGGWIVVTTAAALLLATGCSGADDHRSGQAPRAATSQSPGPVSRPAPAGPDTLAGFDTCDALLAWYVDRSVSEVGPYGWDDVYGGEFLRGAYAGVANLSGPWLDSRADLALPRSGVLDSTGTNTQEADVDEPDTAKTDGHLVVRVVDDARLVLTDVSTDTPRVTARLPLPTGGYGSELLLAGDHVLVTQQYAGEQGPRRLRGPTPVDVGPDRTRLVDIDISDPSAPEVLHQDLYSGGQVSVRRYGATVRLVTSTGRPQLAFTHPGKHLTAREATGRNRALVRASTIDDWLPSVTTGGVRTRLVGCDQVLRPPTWAGSSTVAVTTFPADDPEQRSTVALTADGQVVYSSADRLYVTSTDRPVGGVRPLARDLRPPGGQLRTSVHAFALDGPRTTYVGSGHVYGIVRDRWSFDEHDGHLRVAWSKTGSRGNVNRNGITVFSEAGGALVGAGRISGLGHGDTLQSVRWFDDLAVLVTYRQVDPLVTVDLTDPTRPVALGVLKVPGYSGYLHPLGNGLLLGAGVTAATRTAEQGSQVAVFDIADLRKPVQVSRHAFGPDTGLSVLDDPRAFSWLPDSRTAVTAVVDWTTSRATLVALTVGAHGHLVVRTLARLNTEWQPRTLALPEHRIAVLDHHRIRVLHLD